MRSAVFAMWLASLASVLVAPMPMPQGMPIHCRMRSRTLWLRATRLPRMALRSMKDSSML